MIFLALFLEFLGLILLYKSWRKHRRQVIGNGVAWLLILVALWPWKSAVGLEFGICFWFMEMPIISWALIIFNREYRKVDAPAQLRSSRRIKSSQVRQNIAKVMVAGPLAFMACFVCATGLGMTAGLYFGLAEANQLLLSFSLSLLLWTVTIYWLLTETVQWRTVSLLLVITLSGPALLYGLKL